MEYECTIDLPYPSIQTECKQKEYAYAMLSNVGGSNSEMSAVSLYFYNSILLNQDYAHCFHQISIIEMHHLEIFASLAHHMGLDPRLWSRGRYWTPAYNHYPTKLKQVIENSLQAEKAAIRKYTKQAETIKDENITAILERIILDEQRHVEIFQSMLSC